MKKEILKSLIDLIDENDTDTIFRVLVRFVPEDTPLPDEIEAIAQANQDMHLHGTVSHDNICWE